MESSPNCNFCSKSADEVQFLLAGPSVFICDECAELAAYKIQHLKDEAAKPPEHLVSEGMKKPPEYTANINITLPNPVTQNG